MTLIRVIHTFLKWPFRREVPAHVNISEKLEVGLALNKAYAAEQRRSSQECLYPHGN
jgi:hypothetical protein